MAALVTPRRWLINGIVITLPIVLTLLLLVIVLDFILGLLSPVVDAAAYLWSDEPPDAVIQSMTILSLFAFFLVVGVLADITPGKHISPMLDRAMASVPGLSTVYTGIRRVSDMLVDDESEQFEDVKLIEFPHQDAYMLCFLVGDTPPDIENSVGTREMQTVMVPLGPNPTTNGFIMHMPETNVHDVDFTVEEAVQSIATLGVAAVDIENGR